MTIEFSSVEGLGGAMELGFVQNGMKLMHRAGSLTLGAPVVEANRKVLGWEWTSSFSKDYREWPRYDVPVISANPPCSAWSTLTSKHLRGGDAKIMSCTQEVIDYAGILKEPPLVIAIESVQQAYSTGRAWYQAAREQLLRDTGYEYDLIWVMQSNASMGGCSVRRRVFVVYSRIPFGAEVAQPHRVAKFGDAIRDLMGLKLSAAAQPYKRPPTWWSVPRRAVDGVDGHFVSSKLNDPYVALIRALGSVNKRWQPRQSTTEVLRVIHREGGEIPEPWSRKLDRYLETDFSLGINQTIMWDPALPANVLTGRGPHHSVHWSEPRLMTQRECARVQGFPDTWRIWPSRDYPHLSGTWGKGVPVDAGRWLGQWVKAAVEGSPGTVRGRTLGPRERMIDVTGTYKRVLEYERPWEHQRHVLHEQTPWTSSDEEFTSLAVCDMI